MSLAKLRAQRRWQASEMSWGEHCRKMEEYGQVKVATAHECWVFGAF